MTGSPAASQTHVENPKVEAHGAAIPRIGLGTFRLTGDECTAAVAAALKAGYRHIDTAKMYANEEAVGAGLRAGGVSRADIWVTTKVWWEDIADGALQRSAEASLKRLGLDQVDLLLIHWPNPAVPLAQSIKALCETKARGLARHIGVSNFPVALLDEAWRLTSEPLVCNQCEYHPRLNQTKLIDACRAHGMAFTSYCPLGRAELLADPIVTAIAARHGKTPAQVLLRWHMEQPGIVAIPKSGSPQRIAENIGVFDFSLTSEDMAQLSAMARPDGRLIDPAFAPQWDRAA